MQDLLLQVEPLIPSLRRYARSLLRDAQLADDLVQDCLERVISHWYTRRNDGDTRSWVFTIMHNLAMNQLRQGVTRGPHIPLEDVDESSMVARATQEDALKYRDLLRALDCLPEDQRSVLLLVTVEDFSYEEAAAALQVPIGTIMSRLSRARARLLRLMEAGVPAVSTAAKLKVVK